MGIGQLGLVAGPLIGGLFTEFVTWRWCFYINLPVAAVVGALLGFTHIPEQVSKPAFGVVVKDLHHMLDLVGFVLFAPACIMLLLAVQWGGNQYPWNSSIVIGLFCGAGVNFLVWLAWDYYKKDAALIPLPMLQQQYVWAGCLCFGFFLSVTFTTSYWLPIYFQAVRGKSPAISGVYMLPSILSQMFGALGSGKAVGIFGYYLPWSVASAVLTAIGYGLTSTLDAHTSTGKWIGYQILFGLGRGVGLQMPLVAIQNTIAPAQIATAMSLMFFCSTIGGALFLSFADTIFTNSLRSLLPKQAPEVDAAAVIKAGAYGFRRVVPKPYLSEVLKSYSQSLDNVFYLCVALACACFVLSWALGWKDIRKKEK